jgi:hypothetical protein
MPNWCECQLTIEGDKEVMKRFRETVRCVDGDADDLILCADKIIPYPEEFKKLDEVAHAWDKKYQLLEESCGKLTNEEGERRWKEYITLNGAKPKDGFNSGGYEWQCEHWGTKWGFCHVEIREEDDIHTLFSFDTAWSPPYPLVKKMGEMFPELTFDLLYEEPGMQYNGELKMAAGKVREDWTDDLPENEEEKVKAE